MSSLEDMRDEDLVEQAREGDEAAFRVLAGRYASRLTGRIQRQLSGGLNRKVAASDILQESYLAAFRRFADFEDRGEGSFGRWFSTIVTSKVREAVRRHVGTAKRSVEREVTRTGRGPTIGFAGGGPTPSQVYAGEELKQKAGAAFKELPESYREVILLLREEGLTLDEAADRMGRSRDAVKMLYGRALTRLEELMGLGEGGDDRRRRPTR